MATIDLSEVSSRSPVRVERVSIITSPSRSHISNPTVTIAVDVKPLPRGAYIPAPVGAIVAEFIGRAVEQAAFARLDAQVARENQTRIDEGIDSLYEAAIQAAGNAARQRLRRLRKDSAGRAYLMTYSR